MKLNTALIVDKNTGVYCQNHKEWGTLRACSEFYPDWCHEYEGAAIYFPLDDGCYCDRGYASRSGYKVYEFPTLVQPRKKKAEEIEIFNLL